jgi:hypothetical protein
MMDDGAHWPHRIALVIALVAGVWVAIGEPGQWLFDEAMRAAGISGFVVGPLAMLFAVAVTLAAMLAVYAVTFAVLHLRARS